MSKPNQEYLGDGLYADYDGWQIALRANDPNNEIEVVYLEPQVIKALLKYVEKQCGPLGSIASR